LVQPHMATLSSLMPTLVKKYSNRRLYDTELSRYVTMEELAEKVRAGTDVRVVDAKSGEDLTQSTLLQIILETPASKLLPTSVLSRLIRMQNDALAEFFGRYVSGALDVYLAAKQGAQAALPMFPLAQVPLNATQAMARMLSQVPGWPAWGDPVASGGYASAPQPHPGYAVAPPPPPPPAAPPPDDGVAAMRDEIDALRRAVMGLADAKKPAAKPRRAPSAKPPAKPRRKS
jgi:polyhydroxyalkanoate synthesis repressor PhaR